MSAGVFLHAQDVVKFYLGRRVLDRVSVTASPGQRLGLVGENGAGKSTLLRLLAGVEEPDGGEIVRPADTGLLHQELPYSPGMTISGVMDHALTEVRAGLRRLDAVAAPQLARHPRAVAGRPAGRRLAWSFCAIPS
jgi:macrolide transport system ATP-binding/permease protein